MHKEIESHSDYPINMRMETRKGYNPKDKAQPSPKGKSHKGRPPVQGEGSSKQPPVYKVG